MSVEKLSVSFDARLVKTVRKAARREGKNLSAWIAEALADKVRNEHLREALDDFARDFGAVSPAHLDELVRAARKNSRYTGKLAQKKRQARSAA